MGIAQLKKAELMRSEREKIAKKYNDAFSNRDGIILPVIKPDRVSAWHLFVIKVNNRDTLIEKLKEVGIGTSVHFIPVHKHPYYKKSFGYEESNYPVANMVFESALSLPIWPGMSDIEIEYVVDMVKKFTN